MCASMASRASSSPLTSGAAGAERDLDNPLRVPGTLIRRQAQLKGIQIPVQARFQHAAQLRIHGVLHQQRPVAVETLAGERVRVARRHVDAGLQLLRTARRRELR